MRVLLVGGMGYIGRFLASSLTSSNIEFDVCDLTTAALPPELPPPRFNCAYQSISAEELADYSDVLWFAGHSSVGQSIADPDGCIRNNCLDLYEFASRLRDGTRLVYASSASLYSATGTTAQADAAPSTESDQIVPSANEYDISKFAFDYIAATFLENTVGLRMGTVSGYSPALRPELIFNAMNIAALEHGVVSVSSPASGRSLLFLSDLAALVFALIVDRRDLCGLVNGVSYSATIGVIGSEIAAHYGAQVQLNETVGTPYSFQLDGNLMYSITGLNPVTELSVECERFSKAFSGGGARV